jgi:RNA polymerase sigma-70 factor (ECF subfamily)
VTSASALTRASSGDPVSRGDLFARHAGKLRAYVEFRLGSALSRRVEPDDVVQETFLRAWRDLGSASLSGEGASFGWLTTIARHVIADVARAARARRREGCVQPLEVSSWSRADRLEPAAHEAGPATRAAQAELGDELMAAFRALSPAHRRVIALRHFEQRSAREAAPRLGCSEAAVHALFRRALDAWAAEAERRGAD